MGEGTQVYENSLKKSLHLNRIDGIFYNLSRKQKITDNNDQLPVKYKHDKIHAALFCDKKIIINASIDKKKYQFL